MLPEERCNPSGPGRLADGGPTAAESLRFDTRRAVVVVIDAQNDFCHPDGLQARQGRDVGRLREPVARLAAFLPAARRAGVPVIFVRNLHGPKTDTPAWLARHADRAREQSCQDGTWGAEFFTVQPLADDLVIDKHRYSAFTSTMLEAQLSGIGRDSVLFAGFTTNVCVESSLRDAVCRDLMATLVSDCCGAYTDEAHRRAMDGVAAGFGVVASSQRIVSTWDRLLAQPPNDPATSAPEPHGARA